VTVDPRAVADSRGDHVHDPSQRRSHSATHRSRHAGWSTVGFNQRFGCHLRESGSAQEKKRRPATSQRGLFRQRRAVWVVREGMVAGGDERHRLIGNNRSRLRSSTSMRARSRSSDASVDVTDAG